MTLARVGVLAIRYRCGCAIATTGAGALAEAESCREGARLQRRVVALRRLRHSLGFEDPEVPKVFSATEDAERAVELHRRSAGAVQRTQRLSDPTRAPTEIPRPAPEASGDPAAWCGPGTERRNDEEGGP